MSNLNLPTNYEEIHLKRIEDNIWEVEVVGVPFRNGDTELKGDMHLPRVLIGAIILDRAQLLHEPESDTLYTITTSE